MTERPQAARKTAHDSFTIERTYKASPAHVFRAFSEHNIRKQWFGAEPGTWTPMIQEFDFRVGHGDRDKGRWNDGTVSDFRSRYYEIIPGERIVLTYDMDINDVQISVSLQTIEFFAENGGTRLVLTEQGVYLDDFDDNGGRKQGTEQLIDKMGEVIMAIAG